MELYLQMGHGMQAISKELVEKWRSGNVIISPVNFIDKKNPGIDKVQAYAKKIVSYGGNVLFDPQMFYPKEGHIKLQLYDYWPRDNVSVTDTQVSNNIFIELLRINNSINSSSIILPGKEMNELSLKNGIEWMHSAAEFFAKKTPKSLFATLCLCSETIRNSETIESLCEVLKNVPVNGFYIIPNPSNGEYLVSDPMWVIGMMKLITCLKLYKKKVIVGYSNHQGLIYALANADGLASGTYINTRSFVPAKFKSPTDDDIKHKSTWFYNPQAFSEYKAALLDVAQQRNFLNMFIPQGEFSNSYSEMLFKGAQPSSTNYNETNSFKHYLCCLNTQCKMVSKGTYQETYDSYEFMLNNAENQIRTLKGKGFSGQNRDFSPAIEANRVAMVANNEDYGFKLNFEWQSGN